MEKIQKVSVLGCGWFGLPMAKILVSKGFSVKGSTTSEAKIPMLSGFNIHPFLLDFKPEPDNDATSDFFNCDVLLVNIPPKGRGNGYLLIINKIRYQIKKHKIRQVLFISSTSVYGETNNRVTENDIPDPETGPGKIMLEAENILRRDTTFTTTIIRFAGLVGPGRHPGRFLAGKKGISNGSSPVNLIHLDDCIQIGYNIISKQAFGYIYNGCSPDHPARKDFYLIAANSINLEQPEFIDEKLKWKLIDSTNVPLQLGYEFKIDNWLQWLENSK